MSSQPFETLDEANQFFLVLLQRPHPCIGVPKPQIRSEPSGQYFVDVEKRPEKRTEKGGEISLKNFLRNSDCLTMLKPEAIEAETQRIGTRTSPAFIKIISDLIGVIKKLQGSGFMCSLKKADVMVFYEKNDKNSVRVMVNEFRVMKNDGEGWTSLKTLIEDINSKLKVTANHEMNRLIERIDAGKITGIFELPFFWSLDDRKYFLHCLCSYLKSNKKNPDLLWTSSNLEVAFGSNCDWSPKALGNDIVKLFVRQDEMDREAKGLRLAHQGVPANKFLGIIEFMSYTLVHFQRMKQAILRKQSFPIETRDQLQFVFEHLFPGHIQLLVDRAESLEILRMLVRDPRE